MNAFILHSSPLQARIWQKLLQSQNWTAAILKQEADLRQQVLVSEAENKSPDVILLADNIPNVKLADFCSWLSTRSQKMPLVALSGSPEQSLTTTQRQLAKAKGAKALLPAFSEETIAIEAVKGVKSIATIVGGVEIQNNTLMSCIMGLKSEFEVKTAVPASPKRLYRGQEY